MATMVMYMVSLVLRACKFNHSTCKGSSGERCAG